MNATQIRCYTNSEWFAKSKVVFFIVIKTMFFLFWQSERKPKSSKLNNCDNIVNQSSFLLRSITCDLSSGLKEIEWHVQHFDNYKLLDFVEKKSIRCVFFHFSFIRWMTQRFQLKMLFFFIVWCGIAKLQDHQTVSPQMNNDVQKWTPCQKKSFFITPFTERTSAALTFWWARRQNFSLRIIWSASR